MNEINELLEARIAGVHQAAIEAMAREEKYASEYAQRLTDLRNNIMPSLSEALRLEGLAITPGSIGIFKTGDNNRTWNEGDKLHVSFNAVPTSKAFKFLTFRGYTARGVGKNDERLQEKATELENTLKEATGKSIEVNSCSLEVRDPESKTRRIIFTFWV